VILPESFEIGCSQCEDKSDQETYLLFLKDRGEKGVPRYELITPYHGAFEYDQTHRILDETHPDYPAASEMTGEEIAERVIEIIGINQP